MLQVVDVSTDFTARLDGRRVEICRRDGTLVGIGWWSGTRIEDCSARLSEDDQLEDMIYEGLEATIREEIDEALEAMPSPYNEDGVDLALIDWMLKMRPEERLQTVQTWVNTFGHFIEKAS